MKTSILLGQYIDICKKVDIRDLIEISDFKMFQKGLESKLVYRLKDRNGIRQGYVSKDVCVIIDTDSNIPYIDENSIIVGGVLSTSSMIGANVTLYESIVVQSNIRGNIRIEHSIFENAGIRIVQINGAEQSEITHCTITGQLLLDEGASLHANSSTINATIDIESIRLRLMKTILYGKYYSYCHEDVSDVTIENIKIDESPCILWPWAYYADSYFPNTLKIGKCIFYKIHRQTSKESLVEIVFYSPENDYTKYLTRSEFLGIERKVYGRFSKTYRLLVSWTSGKFR